MSLRKNQSFCRNCEKPVRQLRDGTWVHDDPDEDPRRADYGWVSCQPRSSEDFDGSANPMRPGALRAFLRKRAAAKSACAVEPHVCLIVIKNGMAYPYPSPGVHVEVLDTDGVKMFTLPANMGFWELARRAGVLKRVLFVRGKHIL